MESDAPDGVSVAVVAGIAYMSLALEFSPCNESFQSLIFLSHIFRLTLSVRSGVTFGNIIHLYGLFWSRGWLVGPYFSTFKANHIFHELCQITALPNFPTPLTFTAIAICLRFLAERAKKLCFFRQIHSEGRAVL